MDTENSSEPKMVPLQITGRQCLFDEQLRMFAFF